MRAVIYCRVSDPKQEKNLSLPTQEKACREYCAREGYTVADDQVFIERGHDAKTTNRPEFLAMLDYCRTQKGRVHAVIVYALTRFSRNSVDHHTIAALLRGLGISLRSVTEPIDDTPAGKFMEGVVAAVAQFDNDVRSQRVTVGMKAAVQAGRWPWVAPLGYVNSRDRSRPSLALDLVRAPLIRQAFELRAAGRTVAQILRTLRAGGLTTRKGRPLAKNTLDKILHNRVYAGWVHCKTWKECVPGDFEAIIADDLFTKVQRTLGRKEQALYALERHRNDDDFPLRRFVRCAICQTVLTGSSSTGRGGRRYPFYHCPKGCLRSPKAVLEQAFVELLDHIRPTSRFLTVLRAGVLKRWEHDAADARVTRGKVQTKIGSIEERLRTLDAAWLFERRIDERTYHEQRDRLREELAIAQMDLAAATIEEIDVSGILDFSLHVLTHAAAMWAAAVVDLKQRLQWTLFPTGLDWNGERVGTAVTCLAYYQLEAERGPEYKVVHHPVRTWNQIAAWLQSMNRLREVA